MKKNLVFSFYIFEGWETFFTNVVHFAYLEHFHELYDDALFIVMCDDVNDMNLISSFEKKIIDLGFTNVEFKIEPNTFFREAGPFYHELASKLDNFDGIVTWGHSKGTTNIYVSQESIFNWISLMYFGTMGLMEDCERKFIENYHGGEKFFYGLPLIEGNDEDLPSMYGGAFFNLNPISISARLKKEGRTVPMLSNRGYTEAFPGTLFKMNRLGSYCGAFLFSGYSNFYNYSQKDWEEAFKLVLSDKYNDFIELKNNIWNTLKR